MERYPKIAAANAKITAEIAEHQRAIAAYHRLNKRIEDAWNTVKIKTRLTKIPLFISMGDMDIKLSCNLQDNPFIGIEHGRITYNEGHYDCILKKTVLNVVVQKKLVDSFIAALDSVSDEYIDNSIAQHYLNDENYKYPEIPA